MLLIDASQSVSLHKLNCMIEWVMNISDLRILQSGKTSAR